MSVIIKSVEKNSPAWRCGILPQDCLVSINNKEIIDVLDYRFYQTDSVLKLKIKTVSGDLKDILLEKDEYEELGLNFESYLIDKQKRCRNNCIFCFIDQLPTGLRKSLYFKDDDSRLSFLFGNYITLTNISEREIKRIIEMHISPINVSVHTTNPELRVKMMNNKFAGDSLKVLDRLKDASIKINCQIVSCPLINDGDELQSTLNDLIKLMPSILSIAVVPVGVTKFREGLFPIKSYDKKTAGDLIDMIEKFGDECKKNFNSRIAFASDEFYIKAGRKFHDAEYYEDFYALENGVGCIPLLKNEFYLSLSDKNNMKIKKRRVIIACGKAVEDVMVQMFDDAKEKINGLSGKVVGIKNDFFGHEIDVSGLVVGQDLINQLKGKTDGYDQLLIPIVMLRDARDMFLDDVTVDDVENELGLKVVPTDIDGAKLLDAIIGKK